MPSKSAIVTFLIAFGVLAWIVYFGLRFVTPLNPPMICFLIWHLIGVAPGVALRESKLVLKDVTVQCRE